MLSFGFEGLSLINPIYIFLAQYLIFVLVLPVIYLLLKKESSFVFKIILAAVAAFFFSQVIKFLLPVSRPWGALIKPPLDGSFPSSHTAVAASLATVLWCRHKGAGLLVGLLALLIGLGRVGVRVHYPVDIAGGWLVGFLAAKLAEVATVCWRKKGNGNR